MACVPVREGGLDCRDEVNSVGDVLWVVLHHTCHQPGQSEGDDGDIDVDPTTV